MNRRPAKATALKIILDTASNAKSYAVARLCETKHSNMSPRCRNAREQSTHCMPATCSPINQARSPDNSSSPSLTTDQSTVTSSHSYQQHLQNQTSQSAQPPNSLPPHHHSSKIAASSLFSNPSSQNMHIKIKMSYPKPKP